ncbi:MAG TPA: hypothetical protein VG797_00390, partial [Phycisphaerales bacterium]|nr:hypothetical protein [Phycisphaerales bacterium]
THVRDWKPPSEPFQVFVCKADNATEKVNTEIDRHGKDGRLLSSSTSQYGIWAMTDEEVGRVATFLAQHHHSRTPTSPTTEPPRK